MDRQPKIVDALLDETGKELFLTNAQFRHQVECLSSMLPAMVDGLAVDAVTHQRHAEERTAALMAAQSASGVTVSREMLDSARPRAEDEVYGRAQAAMRRRGW